MISAAHTPATQGQEEIKGRQRRDKPLRDEFAKGTCHSAPLDQLPCRQTRVHHLRPLLGLQKFARQNDAPSQGSSICFIDLNVVPTDGTQCNCDQPAVPCTRQHFQVHLITLMVFDTLKRVWTVYKSTTSTIIGMSTVSDHCLDLGLDYLHPTDICGQEKERKTHKDYNLRPDLMTSGQKYRRK